MATLIASRTAQYPLWAEFRWTSADAMLNTSGTLTNFKANGGVFDVIPLPPGARIVGGELVVETVSNEGGATATVAIGDSGSSTRYLAATSLKSAARTALTITGYAVTTENLRITFVNSNGDATTGSFVIRVMYVVDGRSNEVQIS